MRNLLNEELTNEECTLYNYKKIKGHENYTYFDNH